MLARAERLVSAADYKRVVRRGRRSSTGTITAYAVSSGADAPWRFGFIVAKTVGNAVVRNRVRRRLKAICHTLDATHETDRAFDIVLRAHPQSAHAAFDELEGDVMHLVERVTASRTEVSR